MLPSRKDVRDLLQERTGCEVTLSSGVVYAPSQHERATFGLYVDQQLRTRALVAFDLALATCVASATGMLTPGRAAAERSGGVMTAATGSRMEHLLSDLAALWEPLVGDEVRLYATYLPGSDVPADVPGYAHVLGRRMDLRVSVSGYGHGRLSVVCPPVFPSPRRPMSPTRTAALR
jgi:hypothetical protein